MTTDFLVIGGGIIGINIARELKRLFGDCTVVLIEKEAECGHHASGRNSGVLHSGFYYSHDSLKAKFTRLGNKLLTEYCESKRIPINKCGKLVVAKHRGDHVSLDELMSRARANGIEIQEVTEEEAKAIEPRVKTCERALFSPTTSTVDPLAVVNAMKADAVSEGVEVHCGVRYITRRNSTMYTSSGLYQAGYIVNASGLYADKIARDFGFSEYYRILPFKGLYLHSDEPIGTIRTNIYPVPDLRNPFLGIHFTVTPTGQSKIGPTVIPALWRENYRGVDNFKLTEFTEILIRTFGLMALSDFNFRRLAICELAQYSRARMLSSAGDLVDGIKPAHYRRWGKPGIRAQLLDIKQRKLEMDFVIQGDDRSMHILNAVSPAFTCSISFSNYVCQHLQALIS